MGGAFHITAWTDRHADICGFADELVKTNVRIGSGVALYEYQGVKMLLGLNEAPYLPDNSGSLLSTGQAREYGVWVNDVLKRHGGEQCMIAQDDAGNKVSIPFEVEQGLFQVKLRRPTEDEVNTLPVVWLTSKDDVWDPSVLDLEGEAVLPLYDGDDVDSHELPYSKVSYVSTGEPDFDELVHTREYQRCLVHHGEISQLIGSVVGVFLMGRLVFRTMQDRILSPKPKAKPKPPDYEKYRPMLGWISLDSVRRTFAATTQLAMEVPMRSPLKRHLHSRFPQLNRRRLTEEYATDTLFASDVALGGITCAQLFCGVSSHFTSIHGMKSEHEGPSALEDFIRETGAPRVLRNDNSKMQTGTRWHEVLRKYAIAEATTEPHHPQQNPAEGRIGVVKGYTSRIMDRTGAPSYTWFFCMMYVVFLLNRIAVEGLNWRTPIEVALGDTPDISALLQFSFYEPVYYLDPV
jgi:hypothetical protein